MLKKFVTGKVEKIKNPLFLNIVNYIFEFKLELFCGLTAILLILAFTLGSQSYFLLFIASLVLTLFILFIPRLVYKKFPRWACLIFLLVLIWIDYFVIETLFQNIESLNKNSDVISIILIIGYLYLIGFFLLNLIRGIWSLIKKIKWKFVKKFVIYVEKLLNPSYLFPIKLLTYSIFYIIWFFIKLITELVKIIIDVSKFPFKSFRNFLKSLLIVAVSIYLIASIFVMVDYINKNYGYYGKFFCSVGSPERLKNKVVRIVGSFSEGTGFFISEHEVLTNFHVIDGEPSPKIIFPDGSFVTPTKIEGDSGVDLAVLFTENDYPEMVIPLNKNIKLKDEEPVLATGFPMGTDLVGKATVLKGIYIDFRKSSKDKIGYLQTSLSLVGGMSGGPLTDQCGNVVGINTMGLSGLSLFISAEEANKLIYGFTDQEIEKIEVDPSKSPEDGVIAFYTYLSARQMEKGFDLLSQEYLQKTNFEEWTNRFTDILDVYVYKTEMEENSDDMVFVKFDTQNWVNQELMTHYYEGTWQTILEDGKYKMLKSNIKEVEEPERAWFWE